MKRTVGAVGLALALAVATSASAKPTPPPGPTLGATSCTAKAPITATHCAGWYTGNLNNSASYGDVATILTQLLGTTYTAATVTAIDGGSVSHDAATLDFTTPLFGNTVIAFHVGAANGDGGIGYQGTGFFEFDAGNLVGGLKSLDVDFPGLSNWAVYSTGKYDPPITPPVTPVPEPASWAMMLLGFGGLGAAMRMRRKMATATA